MSQLAISIQNNITFKSIYWTHHLFYRKQTVFKPNERQSDKKSEKKKLFSPTFVAFSSILTFKHFVLQIIINLFMHYYAFNLKDSFFRDKKKTKRQKSGTILKHRKGPKVSRMVRHKKNTNNQNL